MALSVDQKRSILENLLMSVDNDIFNQEMQLVGYQADLEAATTDAERTSAQANIDNVQATINRLNARHAAWQKQLDALGKPAAVNTTPANATA